MNELTRQLRIKGYRLKDIPGALGICLSTFRTYEKPEHPKHDDLKTWIKDLPHKEQAK